VGGRAIFHASTSTHREDLGIVERCHMVDAAAGEHKQQE
jgi:hypothetical protein